MPTIVDDSRVELRPQPPPPSPPPSFASSLGARHAWRGVLLGGVAAVGYTISNMVFREVATPSGIGWAMWATALKTFPSALIAWALVAWRSRRGLPALPPRTHVVSLLGAGAITQLFGNVLFQIALGKAGLAITVAITFSSIIVSGALLGRVLLGEPISRRTTVAMGLLIAAVGILQWGAQADPRAVFPGASPVSITLGALAACGSGVSFGLCGVVIRQALRDKLSHSATLVYIASAGVLLVFPGAMLMGGRALAAVSWDTQWLMLGGGVMNACALFAISGAFQYLSVVRVNLVNSSQVALAALAGVLCFGESVTHSLQIGVGLTIAGFVVLGFDRSRQAAAEAASLTAAVAGGALPDTAHRPEVP